MAKNGLKSTFLAKNPFFGLRAKISRVNDRMKVYNGPLEYSWQLQRSFWPSDNENEVTESNGKPQKMAKNGLKSTFFAKTSVFLGTGWGVSCIMVVHPRAVFGGVWGCFRVSICVLGCRITLFHPWNYLVRTLRMPKIAKKIENLTKNSKVLFRA